MREAELDSLLFFNAQPDALPLFLALEEKLFARFPGARKRVQKTQITYYHKHVFACVSFARVRRKAELPRPWLTLTLGLPSPPASDRVAVKTEVRPGRWTIHRWTAATPWSCLRKTGTTNPSSTPRTSGNGCIRPA